MRIKTSAKVTRYYTLLGVHLENFSENLDLGESDRCITNNLFSEKLCIKAGHFARLFFFSRSKAIKKIKTDS